MTQKPLYVAALPILHNGTAYEAGDVFDPTASDADVAHLLESGALAPEGVALAARDAPAHPDEAAGPAGSDPSHDGTGATGREGPGAAASLPDVAEHLRRELAGPVARLAAAEGGISQLAARLTAFERRLDALEGTAPPPISESAEDRGLRLIDAARGIDPQAAGDWTSAGAPTVAAIERVTGLPDVTAAERDAAWAAVTADRVERAAEG